MVYLEKNFGGRAAINFWELSGKIRDAAQERPIEFDIIRKSTFFRRAKTEKNLQ